MDNPQQDALPRYELIQPFFGPDHVLYPEGVELKYDGTPNEWMRPLNGAAHEKYEQYMRSLPDGRSEPLEKIVERAMIARPRLDTPDAAQQIIDALKMMLKPTEVARGKKTILLPVSEQEKPIMGDDPRVLAAQKRASKVTIVAEEKPVEPRVRPRVPIMGEILQNR